MKNLWTIIVICLLTPLCFSFDQEKLRVTLNTTAPELLDSLNNTRRYIENESSIDEEKLKLIYRTLNKLESRLLRCSNQPQDPSKDSTIQTLGHNLSAKDCQQLTDETMLVKKEVLTKLNSFSFYRYKTRRTSLLQSSTDTTHQSPSIVKYIQVNFKENLFVGTLFFVISWLILKKLNRIDNRNNQSTHWSLHSILIMSTIAFIAIWFTNTTTHYYEIETWYTLLFTASLYLSWLKKFKFSTFIKCLLLFSGSVFSADLLTSDLVNRNNYWLLIADFSLICFWAVILYLSFSSLSNRKKLIFWLSTTFVLALDATGFHELAHQLILTSITFRTLWLFVKLIHDVGPDICRYYFWLISKINFLKSIERNAPLLPGEGWIRWGLTIGISLLVFMSQMTILGIPDYYTEQISSAINEGFQIGTITVSIRSLLEATVIFGMLLGFSSLLKARLEKNDSVNENIAKNGQEAIAAIFWYSAVVTSALIALSIAGFSVQNLALVAGAFSIGIGFGLQNIVSNFVSGLILLIERPIKKGDWIITGNTEGIVKNVNIRATQIQTFDRADIIIPNSDLITTQVTNWMLNDRIGRLRLVIGVAYGSDTEKVKQLLTEIALNHPLTISDNDDYPCQIHFSSFGDSSLNFEIRVFLHNISDIPNVRSDLNYQIDKSFRENGIEIPFPQRDLHIRSDKTKGA
ncbi:mechanosensitive ion channel family protein [Pleionea sediminis]|uniref:mechanosensitive ion channel family protein n=1 Tax=Pleionea sediminis TaxID=2569479 RepID=UPI0011856313|nr:mechanosensitive ion channel domain-containing protein [Pleionea sediminis]